MTEDPARTESASADAAGPDRPLDPVPAQFRVWEVLLFQVLLAMLWAPLVVGLQSPAGWTRRIFDWHTFGCAVAFLPALGPAMMAFVLRDKELGAGARFARVGRIAMAANALAGGCLMLIEYFGLGVLSLSWLYLIPALPCICGFWTGFLTAFMCGALNVRYGNGRPILKWVPLALTILQALALLLF